MRQPGWQEGDELPDWSRQCRRHARPGGLPNSARVDRAIRPLVCAGPKNTGGGNSIGSTVVLPTDSNPLRGNTAEDKIAQSLGENMINVRALIPCLAGAMANNAQVITNDADSTAANWEAHCQPHCGTATESLSKRCTSLTWESDNRAAVREKATVNIVRP